MTTDPISIAKRLDATARDDERANRATLAALGWTYVEPPDGDDCYTVIATRGDARIAVTQYPEYPPVGVVVTRANVRIINSDVVAELLHGYLAAITRLIDGMTT